MAYKFLPHTADIKIQAQAKTLEQAFSESALAIKQAISEKTKIKGKEKKEIEIQGKDFESLLYNFLEEFIYLLDAEDFLLNKIKNIEIDKDQFKLKATLTGDKASKYKFTNHVKAVTYNDMFIRKEKNKYIVQFVLDV